MKKGRDVRRSLFASASAFAFFLLIALSAHADQTYTVKKGDNLSKIARKFKVGQEKIREANDLDSARLTPGTRLTIPSGKSTRTKHASRHEKDLSISGREKKGHGSSLSKTAARERKTHEETTYHTVKKGETLTSVSKKYSLSVSELRELNHLGKSSRLKAGRQLIVKRSEPRTYTVRRGDTIRKVAKKYDMTAEDLLELNELASDDLKPGQKLVLEESAEHAGADAQAVQTNAKIQEEMKTLSESPELNSLGMKDRLILFAKKMLNIPYRFGGSTFMGIDCSGYVQKVFGFLDMSLPRTAREQFHLGEPVSREDLSIGDLVFFRTYASFPSHVGIYLGNNLFIHASSRSRKVSIDSLDTPYYIKRFIGAKRLFPEDLDQPKELGDRG